VQGEEETGMLNPLSRHWWAFLARGLCAVAFGVLTWVWPGITLRVVMVAFGAFALANGILSISKAVDSWAEKDDRWVFVLEGILGIGIAMITLFAPRVTAVALLFYIAAWTLAMGILEIVIAIRLRKEIEGEFWLFLAGVVSVIFAVLLMLFPGSGILGFVWMLAAMTASRGLLIIRKAAAGAGSPGAGALAKAARTARPDRRWKKALAR
jgi:uncharacterized membrane protein HdeD (DUF308 family)